MPFGTAYTTDPGFRNQMHAVTVGSLHTTFGVHQTTNETRTSFADFFSTGESIDKQYTRTYSRPFAGYSGYTTSIGTSQSHIFRNKTSSGTTYIWYEDAQYLTVVGTASTASGATVDVNTGTTTTKTLPPLTVVSTVLSALTSPWGDWTVTESFLEVVPTVTANTNGVSNLGTTTRAATTIALSTVRDITWQAAVSQTVTTVDPVTARTLQVTYPNFGAVLYIQATSPVPVIAVPLTDLQTTDSYVATPMLSTFARTTRITSSFPHISLTSLTSMFTYSTWNDGASHITTQYFETEIMQYSTRTVHVGNVTSTTQGYPVVYSAYTQSTWVANTFNTSYSAEFTSVFSTAVLVITGTDTTISNYVWTTRGIVVPRYERSVLTYVIGDTRFTTSPFPAPDYASVTRGVTYWPWRFTGLLNTGTSTTGYAAIPGNGITPAGSDMSPPSVWGMGLTGIPSTWIRAGLAFRYSTVNSEGRHPVLAPIAGQTYSRWGVSTHTYYKASQSYDSATISRTLSDRTASTIITDQTSFIWQTLTVASSRYTTARRNNYHAPATRYHGAYARIEESSTTYTTLGEGTIISPEGQSLRITPLVHQAMTHAGALGPVVFKPTP